MSSQARVFILTSQVYETAGGRTKATIERMLFLRKHFDATLIEMRAAKYPGQELAKVFEKYQADFKVVNPWHAATTTTSRSQNYLDFLRERSGSLGDASIFGGAQQSFVLPTLSGGKIKSYLQDGKISRLREYHPDGRVEFFAMDDQQNIILHELYN